MHWKKIMSNILFPQINSKIDCHLKSKSLSLIRGFGSVLVTVLTSHPKHVKSIQNSISMGLSQRRILTAHRKFAISRPVRQAALGLAQQALLRQAQQSLLRHPPLTC